MTTDLESSTMENDAPLNRTTNVPPALANGKVGPLESITSNCQVKAINSLSNLETRTGSLSKIDDAPSIERKSSECESLHDLNRSNADELFSPVEVMFILQARSRGLAEAYELFRDGIPASDLLEVGRLPSKLRAIADELETLSG
jgi:hypothetical protein